jgi:hypothetical protein
VAEVDPGAWARHAAFPGRLRQAALVARRAGHRASRSAGSADKGLITDRTFTALVLMPAASTMLTMPTVTPRLARLRASLASRAS